MTGLVHTLGELLHTPLDRFKDSCKTQLVLVSGDHEMVAKPLVAGTISSSGAPGVCTAIGRTQNPPASEKLPPVMGELASCCPMVPLTRKAAPVLVAPPPSIVDHGMLNWARADHAISVNANATEKRSDAFAKRDNRGLDKKDR